MMKNSNWEVLVADLNRMTQDGGLKWGRIDPPQAVVRSGVEVVGFFYFTQYQGKRIGLYREAYKNYTPDMEEFIDNRVVIGLFDSQNRVEYLLPNDIQGAYDLLDAVMFQTAQVDGFLDAWRKDRKDQ